MSRAKNTIKLSDISSTPIKVFYSASYASQSLLDSGITTNRGANIAPSASMSSTNRTRMSNYRLVRQLYYQPYLTGSLLNSASYWAESWQSTAASGTFDDTDLTFPSASNGNVSFLAVPSLTFGEQISRKSFNIASTDTVSYNIVDDGNGNIVDSLSNSVHVGNIFYAQGIVTITNSDYVGIVLNNNFTINGTIVPSPSPTPSVSVTPSITPSVSITPSISVTPSVSITPTVTPSVSRTPSVSITPSVSPGISLTPSISVTPSVSSTPSVSVTPSVSRTPSPTPSVYTVTVDIGFQAALDGSVPPARFWYKLGSGGTKTEIGSSTKTPVCNTTATQGTITNIPAGTSLYIGVEADSTGVRFGAGGCAGSALSNCGFDFSPYIFTVNSNTTVTLKVAVNTGTYMTC